MRAHTHSLTTLVLPDTAAGIINGQEASTRQPKLVTGGVLRPYQLDGMEWLKVRCGTSGRRHKKYLILAHSNE